MKKLLLLIAFMMIINNLFSQEPTYSKWTISGEVGLNRFDGDVNQTMINTFPSSMWGGTYGFDAEYKFNSVFGLSASLYYIPVKAVTNLNGFVKDVGTIIKTGALNSTVDITHLIYPLSKSKLTLNTSIGVGYAFYIYNLNPRLLVSDMYFIEHPSAGISPEFPVTATYGLAFTVPVSFYLDYSLSSKISVGTKITYISFNKDNLEGIWSYKGVTNDREGLFTLYVSYKVPVKTKLPSMQDLEDKAKLNWNKFHLNEKLDSLDRVIKNNKYRLDTLSAYILNKDVNSLKPKLISDTLNDFIPSIYFDFDKYNLDDWALITISKVAKIMIDNPKENITILGYCDWMGNVPYNYNLSNRRVSRTKLELVKIWGINPNRISINGKGKLYNPKMKYRPNRRCDIIFGKLICI